MAPYPGAEGGESHLCSPPSVHSPAHLLCLIGVSLPGQRPWLAEGQGSGGHLTRGWQEIKSKSGNPWMSSCKGDWEGEVEAPRDI